MAATLELELFSDFVCPFCFLGERRLRRTLQAEGRQAHVRFRAYELNPDLPDEGASAAEFFARKFGSAARVQEIFAHVKGLGASEGIAFALEKQLRAPRTRLAHRLFALAVEAGEAPFELSDSIFSAYFEHGVDLGDPTALATFLRTRGHGLSDALLERVRAGDGAASVEADVALGRELGVTGVPLFVAGRIALSGAQPEAVFARFFKAADEQPSA